MLAKLIARCYSRPNPDWYQLLDQVLDEELPRYAEALERLGQ
ncbi:MAG TPA: hypothetical protein VHW06_00580 [Streptosporangiaceae bacterium]|jgi:hypothetical protein|nr:hypothetical protein [Streptosporangiaceae bacterium]